MNNVFKIDWVSIRLNSVGGEDLLRLFLEYVGVSVEFLFKAKAQYMYRNGYNILDRYTSVYYDDVNSEILLVFSGSSSFLDDSNLLLAFFAYHAGLSFTYKCTRIDIAYDDYDSKSFYKDLETCVAKPFLNLELVIAPSNIKLIKNYGLDNFLYTNYMFNNHSHVRSCRIYNKKEQLGLPCDFFYRTELEFRSDNKNSLANTVFTSVVNGEPIADLFLRELGKLFTVPRISEFYDSYNDYVSSIANTVFSRYDMFCHSFIDLELDFLRKFNSFKSNLSFLKLLSCPEFSFYKKELEALVESSSLNKKDFEYLNFFKGKLSNE